MASPGANLGFGTYDGSDSCQVATKKEAAAGHGWHADNHRQTAPMWVPLFTVFCRSPAAPLFSRTRARVAGWARGTAPPFFDQTRYVADWPPFCLSYVSPTAHVSLFGSEYSSDSCGDGPPPIVVVPFCCIACSTRPSFPTLGALAAHLRQTHVGEETSQVLARHRQLRRCHCGLCYAGGAALSNHAKACRTPAPAATGTPRRQAPSPPPEDTDLSSEDSDDSADTIPEPRGPTTRAAQAQVAANQAAAARAIAEGQAATAALVAATQAAAAQEAQEGAEFQHQADAARRSAFAQRAAVYTIPRKLVEVCRALLAHDITLFLDAVASPQGATAQDIETLQRLPGFLQNVRGKSDTRTTLRRLHLLLDPATPPDRLPAPVDILAQPRRQDQAPRYQPSAIPRAKVTKLVEAKCLSRALRLVESSQEHTGVADASPATREALSALFPARSLADCLPDAGADEPALTFGQDLVDLGLQRLPAQSAAGFSGWTYDLVQLLAEGPSAPAVQLRALIRSFALAYMNGRAGPSKGWLRDYIVPLAKATGGLRPIVVGEVWPRIATRIASMAITPSLTMLPPHQWGIGSQGGAEIVAHAGHLFEAVVAKVPGMAAQTVDFVNAFNSSRRRPTYDALDQHARALLRWFRWSYGSSSDLYFRDGTLAAECGTGVRQGDPLACILFCLTLLPIQQVMAAQFPTLSIMADMDDVTAFGPSAVMPTFLGAITAAAADIGLSVHPGKSQAWVRADNPAIDSALRTTTEGHKLMGTFVGTEDYQTMSTRSALEQYSSVVDLLLLLDPNVAFPLLQCCVNTRPVYLARTTAPWISEPLLPAFDARIDGALAHLGGAGGTLLPAAGKLIRALPHREAGLGVPRLADIGTAAWAASFTHAAAVLAEHMPAHLLRCSCPEALPSLDRALVIVKHFVPTIIRSDDDAVDDETGLEFTFWPASAADPVPYMPTPTQKSLCASVAADNKEKLVAVLASTGDRLGKAWHLSTSFSGSGLWLSSSPGCRRLTPQAFRDNLALRLLLPATWAPPGAVMVCTHCDPYPEEDHTPDFRFHCLNCRRGNGARTERHDAVRNCVANGLKKLFGPQAVQVEPHLQAAGAPRLAEPDIALHTGAGVVYLDVSVVNPACQSHLGHRSDTDQAAAAAHMEQTKVNRYRETLLALGLEAGALVPFVVEATGRFGPAASQFMASLGDRPGIRPGVNVATTVRFMIATLRSHILVGNSVCTSRVRDLALALPDPV